MVNGVELVGYLASALVVLSLAMTSVVRLRTISLAGSLAFVVYGVMIGSVPIIITNGSIAVLNVVFLYRELSRSRDLGAVPIAADAPFLLDFLRSHEADIRTFQPAYAGIPDGANAWLLTRDGLPAGAVIGTRGDGTQGGDLNVVFDYVLPAYRDSRLGQWLYGPGVKVFRDAGFSAVVTEASTVAHGNYVRSMGFRAEGSRYVLRLP